MQDQLQDFIARLFAPRIRRPLVVEEVAIGRVLGGHWRQAVEYRLAELGFGLRPDVALRGVPSVRHEAPGRAVYQHGVLFIDAGAVENKRFRPEFLALDLPHALIDRPATPKGDTPEEKIAGRLAAAMLALRRLLDPPELIPVEATLVAVLGQPPERLLTWIAAAVMPVAPAPVRELLQKQGPEVVALAQGLIEGAWQCRVQGTGPDGSPLPVVPVHPSYLARFGLPVRAIEWLCDHYGWTRSARGWHGGFLPLQVLGILRGVCDPTGSLFQSGVVAAPTSAGKTLLAELRFLTRYFVPEGRPRRFLILVPTREIGVERVTQLRAAYGTRGTERRLRILYSDGEHHAEDHLLRAGHFDVGIMVNEKAKYFTQVPGFFSGLGEVVVDELDTLCEPGRGVFLELVLTSALRAHPHLTVLGLTHPAHGLDRVVDALRRKHPDAFLLETTQRPIPLEAGIWAPQARRTTFRDCNTGAERTVTLRLGYPDILETLKQLLLLYVKQTETEIADDRRNNLVIAVPTKNDTMRLAAFLHHLSEKDDEVREILDRNKNTGLLAGRFQRMELTFRKTLLERFMVAGIAFHDADLTREERWLVSRAFREGEVPVMVCTRTMAEGINLPAQTIVFLNWGGRPGSGLSEDPGQPFYHSLESEFVTWIGRVGRYGQKTHRKALALYVAQDPPGSDEYDRMRERINTPRGQFRTLLRSCPSFQEAVLAAIACLKQAMGRCPTPAEIADFLRLAPSATDDEALLELQERATAALLAMAPEPSEVDVADPFVQPEIGLIQPVEQDGITGFELTDLGKIAHAYGATAQTCRHLLWWLEEIAAGEPIGWDVLDLLALVRESPDGQQIQPLRPHRGQWDYIRAAFNAHLRRAGERLGEEWRDRSPVGRRPTGEVYLMATFLSLRDWRCGIPIFAEEDREAGDKESLSAIELAYGLQAPGCSLYEKAREFSRLLRLLAAIADSLPEETFPGPRPESLPGLEDGFVAVPWDLPVLAEEILYGVPHEAVPLARLNVPGFARTWALSLFARVIERNIDPDLPILERVKRLSEDEAVYRDALPTHGLREAVKEELEAKGRVPLAGPLRGERDRVKRFYEYPLVIAAHLAQGEERYTALRMVHRRLYSVIRRNATPDQPIVLKTVKDVEQWRDQGAIEYLSEVGRPFEDGYKIDQFLVDLDPKNDYPLPDLKRLAGEVLRRLSRHEWVDTDAVQVNWTGGKGFHVIAPFADHLFRPVEAVRRALETLVLKLVDGVTLFAKEQPTLADPHVILDLSPVMRRGVYRNAFSIHAGTGDICLPVEPSRLPEFDPEREAGMNAVLMVLDRMGEIEPAATYESLLNRFWTTVREVFSSDTTLPPVREPRARTGAALPALPVTANLPLYQPDHWPPTVITTEERLVEVIAAIEAADRVGVDTECTDFDLHRGRVRLLSLATRHDLWVIDAQTVDLRPVLAALSSKEIIGHNLAFDLGYLMREYGFMPGPVIDTMLLSKILTGETRTGKGFHGLAAVVRRALSVYLPKTLQRSDWTGTLTQDQLEYSARDAAILIPLAEKLREQIDTASLERIMTTEHRCLPALVRMTSAGVPVDTAAWGGLASAAEREAERLRQELEAMAPSAPGIELGLHWNWDSPKQVLEVLRLSGVDVWRTDDETLARCDHPLAAVVRRYRSAKKVATTYGTVWLARVLDGRLYPDWRQIGTATGRITASAPPVQQIPRGLHRRAIAAPSGRVLVWGDYRHLELRLLARIVGELRLYGAFEFGEDPYLTVARQVLGLVGMDGANRRLGKTVALGLCFGMSSAGLRREVGAQLGQVIEEEEAEGYREAFFTLYPRIRVWQERLRQERPREIWSAGGRRLIVEESAPDSVRFNTPVQASAADGLKTVLGLLWERRAKCPGAWPIIAAHDELVIEADQDQAEPASEWLRTAMIDGMKSLLDPIPVVVEITVGESWG
jgi:DNA polymerase-1